ncbi:MAG: COX15/CtaA family protein [Phycisphaerales bacterium]|nr:COX15/CtaA family protein [Phycisphaerales bacterium]
MTNDESNPNAQIPNDQNIWSSRFSVLERFGHLGIRTFEFDSNFEFRISSFTAPAFAITAVTWLVAYLCRMPLVNASAQTTVLSMLAAIFLGGILTARYSTKPLLAAITAGAISGTLNILIVGAMVHDYMNTHSKEIVPATAIWTIGSILTNTLIAGLGGLLGCFVPSSRRNDIHWQQILTIILAATTFPLITAGGLVTAFRAGLAVPDWPQSYGYNMFLFPLSLMQKNEGNFYEHAHRLLATLVGLTALAVAITLTRSSRFSVLAWGGWSIFAAVCLQGILGGTRVTEQSITLAIAHGIFAQMVFAAIAVLATITPQSEGGGGVATSATDRFLTTALIVAITLQLIFGAILRHIDALLLLHIAMAAFVTLIALVCSVRAWGLHSNHRPLVNTAIWTLALLASQLFLGLLALIVRTSPTEPQPVFGALLTTAHQANGALLLALSAVLATLTWRTYIEGSTTR